MTAARAAGNMESARTMKMFSELSSAVPLSEMYALPMMAMAQAAARQMTTQIVATRLEIFRSDGFLIAVYLTMMWGIPKYPRPQARQEMTVAAAIPAPPLYSRLVKWSGASPVLIMLSRMSIVLSQPPSSLTAARGTRTMANIMRIACRRSVQQTALNPPRNV